MGWTQALPGWRENPAGKSGSERAEGFQQAGFFSWCLGNHVFVSPSGIMAIQVCQSPLAIFRRRSDVCQRSAASCPGTLWKHWGRVDPVECVKYINETSGTKSRTDARHVMEGWLEANPEAALAWARDAKNTRLDGAAAAMAMTWNAGGDLKQLEEAILARPPGDMAAKDCLWDYFDLSSLATDSPTAAQVYEKLPPALQDSAWSVTLQRLTYTDLQAGKDWLEQHAGDPGHNYHETQRLVFGLSRQDAEGTAKWAARLPVTDAPGPHPAAIAIGQWLRSDPPVAKAWIATLPADSPWAGTFTNE